MDELEGDLIVGENFLQRALHVLGGILGQDAAVDVGGGELRQGVEGVAAF